MRSVMGFKARVERVPLAVKANDLVALRDAVLDAANVSGTLWFSYLLSLLYLLVAAGTITHLDLFLERPIRLPFLGVELPLKGFAWIGPLLFLISHVYVLLQFVLLAGKIGAFNRELEAQLGGPKEEATRASIRGQLPNNVFVQFLAGPRDIRTGPVGWMLKVIAWFTLIGGPIALLVFFQLQFLPYHNWIIAWWQRIAVLIDLIVLWTLWPAIARCQNVQTAWRSIAYRISMGVRIAARASWRGLVNAIRWLFPPEVSRGNLLPRIWRGARYASMMGLMVISLAPVVLVFAVATYPGEWLNRTFNVAGIDWLRSQIVAGKLDPLLKRLDSPWASFLVLPDQNFVDITKIDGIVSRAAASRTPSWQAQRAQSMVGRDLAGAIFDRADLRYFDFAGADLTGASLIDARLDGADFHDGDLEHADLNGASAVQTGFRNTKVQLTSFDRATLRNADMTNAYGTAPDFHSADLLGASLVSARMPFASFRLANLAMARVDRAVLVGAFFDEGSLQNGVIDGADLRGASVNGANFSGASLRATKLQGAGWGPFQPFMAGADLTGAGVWRFRAIRAQDSIFVASPGALMTEPAPFSSADREMLEKAIGVLPAANRQVAQAQVAVVEGPNPIWTEARVASELEAWRAVPRIDPAERQANVAAGLVEFICNPEFSPAWLWVTEGQPWFMFAGPLATNVENAVTVHNDNNSCPGSAKLTLDDLRAISKAVQTERLQPDLNLLHDF
jgi:uncharacterized protein YjbI with pentapeptide repeats